MALAFSGVLVIRVIAIGKPVALVILAPAIAGGAIGLMWPASRAPAFAATLLILTTAVAGLIGYWGWFYLPSVLLLVAGAARRQPSNTVAQRLAD